MAVKDDKVRKLVTLPRELWERVRRYRFGHEVDTESEALRRLISSGLEAEKSPNPNPSPNPSRKGKRRAR